MSDDTEITKAQVEESMKGVDGLLEGLAAMSQVNRKKSKGDVAKPEPEGQGEAAPSLADSKEEDSRRKKALEKFRLTGENKAAVKKAFLEIIDKQFETFDSTYEDLFGGLPVQLLENMTEKEASNFVSLVVNEAAKGLLSASSEMKKKVVKVMGDESVLTSLTNAFMRDIGFDPSQAPGEIVPPGVKKS